MCDFFSTAKNFIKNLIVNLRIFSNLIKIPLYFLKFFQYFIFYDVFSKLILKIKNKNKLKYPGIIFEKKWTKVCKLDLRSFAEVEENVTIKNSNRDLVEYDTICLLKKSISKSKLLGDCVEIYDKLPEMLMQAS